MSEPNVSVLPKPPMRVYGNSASLIEVISRAAADPNVDVAKMQSLLDMHERLSLRESEQAFNSAMADAQGEMRTIGYDSSNPSTHSKYASYAKIDSVLRPIYSRHGFALSFDTGPNTPENAVEVICRVSHREGYVRAYRILMPADGKGARGNDVMTRTHATGAALSYGARYLLRLIFNVAVGAEDDDGNSASTMPRGSTQTGAIDEGQVETLKALIAAVSADPVKLCVYFQVERIEDLPAASFAKAIDMLNAKAKQKAKP